MVAGLVTSSLHDTIYVVESQVRISVNLTESVELLVVNNNDEVEVALVLQLNSLLDKVLRSPVLGIREIPPAIPTRLLI